jgi:hypothetical protein
MGSCLSSNDGDDEGTSPSPLEGLILRRHSVSSDARRGQLYEKTQRALAVLRQQRADELDAKYETGLLEESTYHQLKSIVSRRRLTLTKMSAGSLKPPVPAVPWGEAPRLDATTKSDLSVDDSFDSGTVHHVTSIDMTAVMSFDASPTDNGTTMQSDLLFKVSDSRDWEMPPRLSTSTMDVVPGSIPDCDNESDAVPLAVNRLHRSSIHTSSHRRRSSHTMKISAGSQRVQFCLPNLDRNEDAVDVNHHGPSIDEAKYPGTTVAVTKCLSQADLDGGIDEIVLQ